MSDRCSSVRDTFIMCLILEFIANGSMDKSCLEKALPFEENEEMRNSTGRTNPPNQTHT